MNPTTSCLLRELRRSSRRTLRFKILRESTLNS
jgi:hypothetical protein